ncbi:MAG: DUF885 domain-containing protein [Bifidobacteriaceae bacterium]|jgi:uncharacterized protein (DUF885 family)|nr:DUF885 domain-containing protein [Bifidobacteriaceae bacterium]
MTSQRRSTAVDTLADRFSNDYFALSPMTATFAGVDADAALDDFSPDGHSARADAARAALRELDGLAPVDAQDRITAAALRERLGVQIERFDAGEHLRDLNVVASPVQDVRGVFDLMPKDTPEAWETITARLRAVPGALASYRASLAEGIRLGLTPAARQVTAGIAQARRACADGSFFQSLAAEGAAVAPALGGDLAQAAAGACAAYGELADFFAEELAGAAPARDAVGRERYQLASRYFLGARVDLDETYEWGLAELGRVVAAMEAVADEIGGPGTSVERAVELSDADPAGRIEGVDALARWMTQTSGAAMNALAGAHFDVPDPVRRLECLIAPTNDGAIYYTGPSLDFSRPGRMWWSVPDGVTEFSTWRERTTVYHEGVPGHHMQVALATYHADELNLWRRTLSWVSGHGEGWALYAERLMEDLGFLPTPADRLGMLDGQRLRAARVVFDIGVHLELPAPEAWGGGRWDADKGWEFLRHNVAMNEGFQRFEYERYLGWPGQAPSYKVGERLWLQARDRAKAAAETAGEPFDLKAFHMRALRLGSLGLDVLTAALAGEFDQ